jgi:hypothetical protein
MLHSSSLSALHLLSLAIVLCPFFIRDLLRQPLFPSKLSFPVNNLFLLIFIYICFASTSLCSPIFSILLCPPNFSFFYHLKKGASFNSALRKGTSALTIHFFPFLLYSFISPHFCYHLLSFWSLLVTSISQVQTY